MKIFCYDCNIDVKAINEMYMVENHVWTESGMEHGWNKGFLCIGCLEKRLGRVLRKNDFTQCLFNQWLLNDEHIKYTASKRLLSRMKGKDV